MPRACLFFHTHKYLSCFFIHGYIPSSDITVNFSLAETIAPLLLATSRLLNLTNLSHEGANS